MAFLADPLIIHGINSHTGKPVVIGRELVGESCLKCGSTDISLIFHDAGCTRDACSCVKCSSSSHHKEHQQHLHYHCGVCYYDWIGPTQDSPDPAQLQIGETE